MSPGITLVALRAGVGIVEPAGLAYRATQLRIPGEDRRLVQSEASDAAAAVVTRQRQDRVLREEAIAFSPTLVRVDVQRLGNGEGLTAFPRRGNCRVDRRPRTIAAVPVAIDDC